MSEPQELKQCPYCGEDILAVAIKCKHCKSDLTKKQEDKLGARYSTKSEDVLAPRNSYGVHVLDARRRLGRYRYFCYTLFIYLLMFVAFCIEGYLAHFSKSIISADGALNLLIVLWILTFLIGMVLQILITIRRFHDLNASGWCAVVMIVPAAAAIFALVLVIFSGTAGDNRYGPAPLPDST